MSGGQRALAGILFAIILAVTVDPAAGQAPDIRTFVHRIYIEGVPYEEAARFDPAASVPILLDMLADPKEADYWPNIVVTLGMLGDERAVDPLIQFLQQGATAPLSHPQYIAKSSVVMALGYIVNKSGSEKALQFLVESTDPEVWTRRDIKWSSPYHSTEVERNRQLTIMSVLGLGLSGDPRAARVLRSLRQAPATPQAKNLRAQIPDVGDVLKDALQANQKIAKTGMADYYRQRFPKPLPGTK